MLMLTITPDDYVTINGNIVIKVAEASPTRIRLCIDADRSVPIVRGEVLERNGGERPDWVDQAPSRRAWDKVVYRWSNKKERAARAVEETISRLEASGAAEEAAKLRRELADIIPPVRPDGQERE